MNPGKDVWYEVMDQVRDQTWYQIEKQVCESVLLKVCGQLRETLNEPG